MTCCDAEESGCKSSCCDGSKKEAAKPSCCTGGTLRHLQPDEDDMVTCIGLIAKDGSAIAIYDVKGDLQTFSLPNGDIRKLCFSSHGHDADDLLTPCFDDEGLHGEPEESCFCGVDTPHLHAHVHDPKTCNDLTTTDKKKNDLETDLMLLARLTLHPTKSSSSTTMAELHIPLDESKKTAFNKCNSMDYEPVVPKEGEPPLAEIKVLHGDHFDFLVYNHRTKELHLEHPCDDCGDRDWHGSYQLVEKRKWQAECKVQLNVYDQAKQRVEMILGEDALDQNCCSKNACNAGTEPKSTSTGGDCCGRDSLGKEGSSTKSSDCCSGGKCSTKDSTSATVKTLETDSVTCCSDESICPKECCSTGFCTRKRKKPGNNVRSTFHCVAICCASEIPAINSILDPINGIAQVKVNVPLMKVIIDHDCLKISATEIERILNVNSFGAKVERDGGQAMNEKSVGRSRFFVEKICCASEIPAIRSIVEPIDGVSGILINVTTKMVYVDHDCSVVSAQNICKALNEESFGARVEHDHSQFTGAMSAFVVSNFSIDALNTGLGGKLELFLDSLPKEHIQRYETNRSAGQLTIIHNPLFVTAQELADDLTKKTGAKTIVKLDGSEGKVWEFPSPEEEKSTKENESCCMEPVVALSGLFWILSMFSYIGGNWEYLKYLGLVSVAFGLPKIVVKACRTLKRCQFDANCLMLFAALGAVALQEFAEAAAVTFLFSLSEWLEVHATSRAREALSAIVNLRPEEANLIHPQTKEVIAVPVRAVPVGAMVSVKSGDKIPCDGLVVEGATTVDESSLTGESRPVKKAAGDDVQGGTVNSGNSQIIVQTSRSSEDSAVSRLIRLVEEAQANRSETEKLVDTFAKVYTPIIVFVALCMCTIPWAWGREIGREWAQMGLILVVIACPCALIISTPVSYVAGLAATAQNGVLIKGGACLEALGNVSMVFFDKTGTLTQGDFSLRHLEVMSKHYSRVQVLQYLSLMEERASHPLAQALVNGAKNEGVKVPSTMFVHDHTFLPGEGISGVIDGLRVFVGNERLFSRLGLLQSLPRDKQQAIKAWEVEGGTVGFMSIGEEGLVCLYCITDAVRPESKQVLHDFSCMGIEVAMLTGDKRVTAVAIGESIGLSQEQIKSELLPEEKLSILMHAKAQAFQQRHSCHFLPAKNMVLMCGDGVNDAPSLAASDVGVAMGAGAALAMETADVTLMDCNLSKLCYSIKMGKRVIHKIKQNVTFSLIVKFVVLGFALAGKASLWGAIASDVGAMILVTLNGMSLLPLGRKKMQNSDLEETRSASTEV